MLIKILGLMKNKYQMNVIKFQNNCMELIDGLINLEKIIFFI